MIRLPNNPLPLLLLANGYAKASMNFEKTVNIYFSVLKQIEGHSESGASLLYMLLAVTYISSL